MTKYTKEFKSNIIKKMLPPNANTVAEIAQETGISYQTLYTWKRQALSSGVAAVGSDNSAHQWSDEAKLAVLIETAPMNEAELGAYCREKGIYTEQINQWREAAVSGQSKSLSAKERDDLRALKKQNKELKKELARKEKALAEAAALVVLQKKSRAIWGNAEDD